MILLLRRRTITVLVLIAVVLALGMSVLAYLSLQTAGELSPLERKVLSERILLLGIVGALIVLASLALAAYDAVNLNSVFKRLSGMHHMSGDQLQMMLRSLGSVGDQISDLYDNLNDLSARKSTLIAALNSLLSAVLARTDKNMLIVNAAGKIYRATPAAMEYLELSSANVTDKPIDDVIDTEQFAETAAAATRSVGAHAIEGGRDAVVVIPVMNNQGLAAYYLYLFGRDATDELKQKQQQRTVPRNGAAEHEHEAGESSPAPEQRHGGESPNAIQTLLNYVLRKRS